MSSRKRWASAAVAAVVVVTIVGLAARATHGPDAVSRIAGSSTTGPAGRIATLDLAGLGSGEEVTVAQCRPGATDASDCDLSTGQVVFGDASGRTSVRIPVAGRIQAGGGVDCSRGDCTFGVVPGSGSAGGQVDVVPTPRDALTIEIEGAQLAEVSPGRARAAVKAIATCDRPMRLDIDRELVQGTTRRAFTRSIACGPGRRVIVFSVFSDFTTGPARAMVRARGVARGVEVARAADSEGVDLFAQQAQAAIVVPIVSDVANAVAREEFLLELRALLDQEADIDREFRDQIAAGPR